MYLIIITYQYVAVYVVQMHNHFERIYRVLTQAFNILLSINWK